MCCRQPHAVCRLSCNVLPSQTRVSPTTICASDLGRSSHERLLSSSTSGALRAELGRVPLSLCCHRQCCRRIGSLCCVLLGLTALDKEIIVNGAGCGLVIHPRGMSGDAGCAGERKCYSSRGRAVDVIADSEMIFRLVASRGGSAERSRFEKGVVDALCKAKHDGAAASRTKQRRGFRDTGVQQCQDAVTKIVVQSCCSHVTDRTSSTLSGLPVDI